MLEYDIVILYTFFFFKKVSVLMDKDAKENARFIFTVQFYYHPNSRNI